MAALSVVKPGDAPAKKTKPLTLAEAVESGVYLEILRAQRRQIAIDLPEEKGPAKAALHRQLSLLAKEISTLEAAEKQEADEHVQVADEAFDASAI